jgi:hypothetical protein
MQRANARARFVCADTADVVAGEPPQAAASRVVPRAVTATVIRIACSVAAAPEVGLKHGPSSANAQDSRAILAS